MNKKYWLLALIFALLLCVFVSLLLVSRINDARSNLAQASPGAFNYLLQNNRNLDEYVDALRDSQAPGISGEKRDQLRRVYQHRFDIVWGGFSVFEINFRFQPEQQKQVTDLIEYTTNYLSKSEPLMAPDYILNAVERKLLIDGARSITDKIVNIGHQYFIYASQLSDLWNEKLHKLYQLFWLCVVFLLLTAALLFSMLVRSFRRSSELIEKSHKSQKEMKRLIDELRSGKLENKAKDSFIAAASHDLRQPLHALGLFLGATEKHIENDAGRTALAEAKQCTAELNRLFNSLLDLSRLDAGVVEVKKTQFRVDRLMSLMDPEFSALAKQSGKAFDICKECHSIYTDAILLNRILRNLLENAFTHSGASRVAILCERKVDVLRLTVADDGVGIPVAEQSDIFSEYYQLDKPERDRSKGLGLGLSIVKRLCDILGIDVTLESAVGKGTKFHLDVPVVNVVPGFSYQPVPVVESAQRYDKPEGALIAVIDDDAHVRRGMISILESLDFDAIAAESATEMIRTLRQHDLLPDILVADYRLLDNQTGDMAIRQVRSAFGIEFPAMIITGDTSPGRMSEAASSGFELMHKPVEPDELVERLSRLLLQEEPALAEVD
ncbi:MAG: ATP-binding protein [Granulosicoccus sp.]